MPQYIKPKNSFKFFAFFMGYRRIEIKLLPNFASIVNRLSGSDRDRECRVKGLAGVIYD